MLHTTISILTPLSTYYNPLEYNLQPLANLQLLENLQPFLESASIYVQELNIMEYFSM